MEFELPMQAIVGSDMYTRQFGLVCDFENYQNRELAIRYGLRYGEYIDGKAIRFSLGYTVNDDNTIRMKDGSITISMASGPWFIIFFSDLPEMRRVLVAHFSKIETLNVSFSSAVTTFNPEQRTIDALERMNIHTDSVRQSVAEFERHINAVYAETFVNIDACPLLK